MVIEKILNNNVVVTIDPKTQKEIILMGGGLGFNKKIGQEVQQDKIEKIFTIHDEDLVTKFKTLAQEIPVKIFECVDKIINYAQIKLDRKLDDHIYISLSDHLAFAIKRLENNIVIKNTLLEEIRRVHKNEFAIGVWVVNFINEQFKIELPLDEAGFIAFHLINATYNDNMQESYIMTKIVKDVLNIIRYFYAIEFVEEDLNYDRLLTHLKYFAKRVVTRKQHKVKGNNFIELVKVSYPEAYNCSLKIKEYIDKKYEYLVNDEEVVYLTMHIHRVTTKEIT